jgi:hypothetical protein
MKTGLLASMALFVIACCLPALEWRSTNDPRDVMLGLRALAVGWSGIFAGVFAWYANPFWMLGLLFGFLRKPVPAALIGLIAIGVSCTTFLAIGQELPGDEGNVTKTTIVRLLPGCYLWMASLVALPAAVLLNSSRMPRR